LDTPPLRNNFLPDSGALPDIGIVTGRISAVIPIAGFLTVGLRINLHPSFRTFFHMGIIAFRI
jgi:hypothetical protein